MSKDKVVKINDGSYRVEWASKNTHRMRRIDQRQIDRYLMDGRVTHSQHQAANWYLHLSQTAMAVPHLTSQIGKLRVGTGKPVISNKQAEARVVLGKVDNEIKKNTSSEYLSLLRNTLIYDESMREQQRKYGGKIRTEGMMMLCHALDALDKVMGKFSKYV